MSCAKGTLLITPHKNLQSVKPEPPADLWERLAELQSPPPRPANSFTSKEYRERFHVGATIAKDRIAKLIEAGKVERRRTGNATYYVLL